ncbi:MFS transporter [Yinghuangia seranimata]|uniref:MFS transporter n=1 Tax=Yinghuangia seranimata TaxID=408067 RepID=UPI00248C4265|nr:MFS transporter [Yinghuangia seranimata]MDI2128839.1 MFS transporter [Yinghuangia seranimata]
MENIRQEAHPRRWWALAALALSVLALGLDSTVLNVALPTLATGLGADNGDLQWIVDGYIVVFAAALVPAGLLGDRFGRKRMILLGLGLFGTASLLGAFADSVPQVIAARAAMGAGGALVMPLSMSILPSVFPAEERSRAIGVWAAATALGLPLGPIVGGALLEHFWWGSVFLLNLPLVAIAITAAVLWIPESKDPEARRIDVPVSLLGAAGLAVVVLGGTEASRLGWTDPRVLGYLAGGVVLIAAVVIRETRRRAPMIDFSLFRNRNFLWGSLAAVVPSFVLTGVLFVLPQRFAAVDGHGSLGTGLRLLPLIGGVFAAAVVSAPMVARFGFRVVIPTGMLVAAAGVFLGATGSADDGYGFTAAWLALSGFGLGVAMIPGMDAVLATLSPERAGVGSALMQTLEQVAGALGVAMLGSILAGAYTDRLGVAGPANDSVASAVEIAHRTADPGLLASAQDAFVHGMDLVLVACGAASVLAAVLVGAFLPGRSAAAPAPADTTDLAPDAESDDTARVPA